MTVVPVLDRFARAWPRRPDAPIVEYAPLEVALTREHGYDAHFAAYCSPSPHRLDKTAVGKAPISMQLFVVDVDAPDHAPTDAWRAGQDPAIDRALERYPGAFVYETRGGYRMVWRLPDWPIEIRAAQDEADWSATYRAWLDALDETGVLGDRRVVDWTRLYRLPRVLRDGEPSDARSTGDPSAIGLWPLEPVEAPPLRDLSAVEEQHDFPEASPALIAEARRWLAAHGPAVQGQGGDHHTFVACARLKRGYALSDAEAVPLLVEWDRGNIPPWGEDLRDKLDNAENYGSGERGEARHEFELTERVRAALTAEASRQRSGLTDLVDLFSGEGTSALPAAPTAEAGTYRAALQQAAIDVERYLGASSGHSEDEVPLFAVRDLLSASYPPTPWLVRGLIVEGGIAVVATEPKSAKTWLATELAVAVATGTAACGKFEAQPRRVAYFYTEDLKKAVRNRVRSLAAGRGVAPERVMERLFVEPRGRAIDVTKPRECAIIIASCRHVVGDVGLLVLDPLRNIHTGKENEADAMAAVFRNLRMLGELLRCTVLIVHHSAKSSDDTRERRPGQKMRGSSAIHGFVDSGVYLEGLSGDGASTFTSTVKSEVKAARSARPFELTLRIEDDAHDEAVRASWQVGDKGETAPSEADVATWQETAFECVDAVYRLDKRREAITVRAIHAYAKGGKPALNVALRRAIQAGWLVQNGRGTYALTGPGRELAEDRLRPNAASAPTEQEISALLE